MESSTGHLADPGTRDNPSEEVVSLAPCNSQAAIILFKLQLMPAAQQKRSICRRCIRVNCSWGPNRLRIIAFNSTLKRYSHSTNPTCLRKRGSISHLSQSIQRLNRFWKINQSWDVLGGEWRIQLSPTSPLLSSKIELMSTTGIGPRSKSLWNWVALSLEIRTSNWILTPTSIT